MDFTWTIQKVQVAEDNLIVKVELVVIGTDGDYSASAFYGRDLVRGDSFIPYEQLTEQQVLDWCFAPETITYEIKGVEHSITKYLKDDGEAQVADQIQRRLAQKAIEPALPWANVAQPE